MMEEHQTSLFEEKKQVPKSIFKSACQKHIRRGNPEAALRCAKGNIEQDALDFSRRIMVIAPEDVSIHPLMVDVMEINKRLSKKGEVATDHDKDVMLSIVRDCAMAEWRDCWEYKPETKFRLTKEIYEYLQPWQQKILVACKYRGSIGGMKGDLEMFRTMINHASEMWANGKRYDYELFYGKDFDKRPLVNNKEIEMPSREDIPWYAVDFHCFPPIIRLCLHKPRWEDGQKIQEPTALKQFVDENMPKTDKKYYNDEQFVKDTIWFMSSAENYKLDYETGKKLDTARAEGYSSNDIKIMEEAHEIMLPIWKDIVEWYLGNYYE